jgi:hypothetical protein
MRAMSGTETGRVTSADGTSIVFDQSGAGPSVVLVHGAFTGRAHPILSEVQGSGVFRDCPFVSYSRPWRQRASAGVVWSRRPSGTCR